MAGIEDREVRGDALTWERLEAIYQDLRREDTPERREAAQRMTLALDLGMLPEETREVLRRYYRDLGLDVTRGEA